MNGWRVLAKRAVISAAAVLTLVAGTAALSLAGDQQVPEQDPELLRFARRAVAWYPDSSFRIVRSERHQTPSGAYRVVSVERSCASPFLTGTFTLVVDEVTRTAWVGSAATLPATAAGIDPLRLRQFLGDFLPGAMEANVGQRVRVVWEQATGGGALMPFKMMVDTGYGEYEKNAGVTADGRLVAMGSKLPLDQDPVAYRKQLLEGSRLVVWDHPGKDPRVDIVEFSDLECPGCRAKWTLIKDALSTYGDAVRHGMVSYPLPAIHPWSFRAASAAWCVAAQNPLQLLPFKELFYSLQKDMEVSMVTDTALTFVAANELDEESFRSCYLREPSLEAVHGQLALGHSMGVLGTPTYLVDGWVVQVPDDEWFLPMLGRLVDGDDLD